jgi:hypothetical protein
MEFGLWVSRENYIGIVSISIKGKGGKIRISVSLAVHTDAFKLI